MTNFSSSRDPSRRFFGLPEAARTDRRVGKDSPSRSDGRSCATCHLPESGWGINPDQIEALFAETGGVSPIFNLLDANSPTSDVSTAEARYAYSMLRKGLFRRTANRPGGAGTGTWASVNRFKVPSLRGVAARAPYFHNGVAKTLRDVVVHYEEKLGFVYTPEEEADLVAFMNAL